MLWQNTVKRLVLDLFVSLHYINYLRHVACLEINDAFLNRIFYILFYIYLTMEVINKQINKLLLIAEGNNEREL
jgi:hypothetical protein